jgi:hypothetical protein
MSLVCLELNTHKAARSRWRAPKVLKNVDSIRKNGDKLSRGVATFKKMAYVDASERAGMMIA